jgi:hypothetical protein
VNIRQKPGVRPPLGMADVMSEHRRFAAHVTLQVVSPLDRESSLQ